MSTTSETDRIERSVLIHATRERVWRALSNAEEFGAWFGVDLAGKVFTPGERTRAQFTKPGCEELFLNLVIDRIQAQETLSFHWHPYAMDPAIDYSSEEPTLVTFTLKDAPGNSILLTVVESGFDKVPAQRRSKAFEMNTGGWEAQLKNLARHAGQ